MVSTAGSGYSKCGNNAVTRWKEDATRDNWGSFIFIKDLSLNTIWSTSYQPFTRFPESYKVVFAEDKVEFQRRDGDISSNTQILVAPEDNVEIRHVTLTNHTDEPRVLELTSYLEPVLGPIANDSDHPAFSKLFIQTEFLNSKKALLAVRRKQSVHEVENWGLHVVMTDGQILSDVQYETDRARFIGRGRTLINAAALAEGESLSNAAGATLDPILSLRIKVLVPPNGKTRVAFTTGLSSSREEVLQLADRYHDIHAFERECKMAWTKSQADLRHLNINSDTAALYQCIAERLLFNDPSLRPAADSPPIDSNIQSILQANGMTGNLPIAVLRISDQKDISKVRILLRCHEYLRLKGLVYDFIIVNDQETTYLQELQNELMQQIRTTGSQEWVGKTGGVFILRNDITSEKEIYHIQAFARVLLLADQPLPEQIIRKIPEERYPSDISFSESKQADGMTLTPKQDLDFFNGFGGFSGNGNEYAIVLSAGQWTPAPWINVVSNGYGFGFQISEVGSGYTWWINSQTNRLTPWSNDPVSDPSGEIIYLRDDDTGEIWTPTPLPIRSEAPYVIKHGQGYSIFSLTDHGLEHSLTVFVPKNDSIKISLLTLKNLTNRKRRISVTSYTEWVLGTQREQTAPFLKCDLDQTSHAIFAQNPHAAEFGPKIAFADISLANCTFTCSRKEFLGRNGTYANPKSLKRVGLSGKNETGQDPCAALQGRIELEPV